MTGMTEPTLDPILIAAIDLIGRTGAREFQLRYSDDENPVVWFTVASYGNAQKVGAGLSPAEAACDLAEKLIDGGICTHCHRVTMFDADPLGASVFDMAACCYRYDPELNTFRRSCEGSTR